MPRQRSKDSHVDVRTKDDQDFINAERDFIINGIDLKEIAEKYKKNLGTVRNWHYDYNWRSKRQSHNEKLGDKIFEECAKSACEVIRLGLHNAKILAEIINDGLIYLDSLKDECTDKPLVMKYYRSCNDLATLANKAAQVYRGYTPEINADMAERMIQSIEKTKTEIKETQQNDQA